MNRLSHRIPATFSFGVRPTAALLLCLACLLSACASGVAEQGTPERTAASLRFIGEQRIALKQAYQATVVGGLSGIEYDPKSDTWIMESDDRSDINPARFYTARLNYDVKAFSSVALTGVSFF